MVGGADYNKPMNKLHDMHCHLDFVKNAEEVAAEAREAGTLLFANTVTPAGYETATNRFIGFENVRVGLGAHPWWVDDSFDLGKFERLSQRSRYIGEIGLDFGKRHQETRDVQHEVFVEIANLCAQQKDKVVSLHSVHAAKEVLDVLQGAAILQTCACIFHWFTGPSDQLKRAIDAGCYFSVGPRMLATGKGREYVKAIPARQLLLETDDPPQQGQGYSFAELRANLLSAAERVVSIKGENALTIASANAASLLRP